MSLSQTFTPYYDLDSYAARILPGTGGTEVIVSKDGARGEATSEYGEYVAALMACTSMGLDTSTPPPNPADPAGGPAPQTPWPDKIIRLSDYDNSTPAVDGQAVVWDADLAKFVPRSVPAITPVTTVVYGGADTGKAITPTGNTQVGQVPDGWAPRSGHGIYMGTVVDDQIVAGNMTYRNAAGQPTGTKMPLHILSATGMQVIDVPTSTGYTETIGTNGVTGGADISDVVEIDLGDGVTRVACVSFQPYHGWNIATYGEHPAYLVFARGTDGTWTYDATRSKTLSQLYADAPSGWRASLLPSAVNTHGETYRPSPGLNELTLCPASGHLLATCYYPASGTQSGSIVAIDPATSTLVAYTRLPNYTDPATGHNVQWAPREIKASPAGVSGDERAIVFADCVDLSTSGQLLHTALEIKYDSTTATITATSAPFLPYGDASDFSTGDYSADGTFYAATHNAVSGLPGLASRSLHVYRPGAALPGTGAAYGTAVDPSWAVYGMGASGAVPFSISVDPASGSVVTVGAYGGKALAFTPTGGDPVNIGQNPAFATTGANWAGRLFSGTTAWSSGDSGRLAVTSLVSTGSLSAKEDWQPVTPAQVGQSMWASAQVRSAATARSARIGIEFAPASGVAFGQVYGPYRTDATGSVTELRCGATIPVGATQFRLFVEWLAPAVSEVHYLLGYSVGFVPGRVAPQVNVNSSRFSTSAGANFRQVGIRGRSVVAILQPYDSGHAYPSAPYSLDSWVVEIPLALFEINGAAGNDPRLSDNRTPVDGSVTDAKVAADAAIAESKLALASDAAAGTASRRTLGTGPLQAAPGTLSSIVPSGKVPSPTSAVWQSMPRWATMLQTVAIASGTINVTAGIVPGGTPITSIVYTAGSTAGSGITHSWAFIADFATRAILAISADDTTAAWAANSQRVFTLGALWTPAANAEVFFGLMVSGTTPPTLQGVTPLVQSAGLAPAICGASTAGQTTPPALGTVIASPATANKFHYIIAQ